MSLWDWLPSDLKNHILELNRSENFVQCMKQLLKATWQIKDKLDARGWRLERQQWIARDTDGGDSWLPMRITHPWEIWIMETESGTIDEQRNRIMAVKLATEIRKSFYTGVYNVKRNESLGSAAP